MDERVSRLKTPDDCAKFIANARKQRREDLVLEATQRAVELRAITHGAGSQVERECIEAIYAFEEVKSAEKKRLSPGKKVSRYRANRTWDMVTDHGILGAAERAVDRRDATTGFQALKEAGLERFAFESVILRHPESFSASAVARSRERMQS